MKRLLKNLAFAGLCALALFVGHVFGYGLLIYRSDRIGTHDWLEPGTEMVDPLYNPWYVTSEVLVFPMMESRYGWSPYTSRTGYFETGGLIQVFVVLFGVSVAGGLLARGVPLRFAPNRIYLAPESSRKQIARRWRAELQRPGRWGLLAGAGFAGGFVAFVMDDLLSLTKTALQLSGAAVSSPSPVWGHFSLYDGTLLVVFAGGLPLFTLVLSARTRILRNQGFRDRWCIGCGYPRLSHGPEGNQKTTRCPECGGEATPHRSSHRFIKRGLPMVVVLSAVVLSITTYSLAPAAVYAAAGLDLTLIDPKLATHDLVRLARRSDLGPVVRIDRPDATLWIALDRDPPDPSQPNISRLRILVQARPTDSEDERAHPIRSLSMTMTSGVKSTLSLPARTGSAAVIEVVGPPPYVGAYVYISPRSATAVVHVAPGDHPPFEEP